MLSKLTLSVPDLWRRLALPGEPKAVCRCPFHPDRTASFSIYRQGQRWKCFAGCGSGDAVGLLAKATGLTNREAFHKALELASGGSIQAAFTPLAATPEPKPGNPVLPADLHRGSPLELRRVASLRGLSLAGVELASARGLLRFGRVCGLPCWIVIDAARILAQARRMDGQPFPAFGPQAARKAHTLKGSRQSWPLGIREAADASTLLLVEGGPDLLAACHFIVLANRERELAAVAILGAGNRLPADALALFKGKVRPHLPGCRQKWRGSCGALAEAAHRRRSERGGRFQLASFLPARWETSQRLERRGPHDGGRATGGAVTMMTVPEGAEGEQALVSVSAPLPAAGRASHRGKHLPCNARPASLAGPCVLGILSASIGAGLEVQSGPKRASRANLFIMPSAESGSGKSEVISQAAAPFYEFERERLERWKTDTLPGAKAEAEMLQAEIGRLKKTAATAEGGEEREGIRAQLQTKLAAAAAAEEAMRVRRALRGRRDHRKACPDAFPSR